MENAFSVQCKISKPQQEVWNLLFYRMSDWWSSDFYTHQKTKAFILEMKLGGMMYEDYGNHEGLVWAEVLQIDSPNCLLLKGNLSSEFGGPNVTFDKFQLTQFEAYTEITYSSEFVGSVSKKTLESLKTGWESIFSDYFIPFCKKI